ncbi:heterokaryon incompatibility protein-domain-containing protein [Dactylonectria macrodidyma]|uniref:Heterokaryon incompatibility protein-domain-containing protein n=1 Tax=Dactylonectria macrodidyma TaxID=307937 RepID=A0A9P9FNG1_9HYPO|nr:heterokaryon incompatibility protein-domain-containing protein [Dactylonectria macrodidyma]
MSAYIWRVFDLAWGFKLPDFGLRFRFPIARSYFLSFGCWLHVKSHDIQRHATPASSHGEQFEYLPLDSNQIRLFVLHPGLDTDLVSGNVEHTGSWGRYGKNYRAYEALSYVWGDLGDSTTILVDDRTIKVTKSLDAALRRLRHRDKPRILWVDYICINQGDVLERNQQVAKMGSIYHQADCVLIWLGLATPNSSMGMEMLRYFAHEERPQTLPLWQTKPQSLVLQGLQDVMSRPWFKRMWVVQEVGRSQRAVLMCGSDCVEWESTNFIIVRRFVRMIKFAEILPEWTQLGFDVVDMRPLLEMLDFQDMDHFSKSWGKCERAAPDLLDLAHSMRYKQCLDPRDKIFGLWGLIDHLYDWEDFKLDYNMSVKEVYDEVARVSFK